MKNKIIIFITTVSLFIASCTTNEYEEPGAISSVGFYTSVGSRAEINVALLNYTTFSDLSQGAISHSWTIPEGNFFLKGPIDNNQNNYEELIINRGDTVTTEKSAIVYFKKAGLQKVRLQNIFNDSVNFRGFRNGAEYDFSSTKLGDKWVIDTTFVVKVFDTITPQIAVLKDDAPVVLQPDGGITLEAGESLTFIDNTVLGEPTGRRWSVKFTEELGGEEVASSTEQTANIVFKKLGTFVTSIRSSRAGLDIPSATKTINYTNRITVIPSSLPFQISEINEAENETLQVFFNGELDEVTNVSEFFKVSVNGTDAAISSIGRNASDSSILDIKLADPIYRPDVITVTLLDGSGMKSTDERTPVAFENVVVNMHDVNLLPEDAATVESLSLWKHLEPSSFVSVSVSDEQSASGNNSVKIEVKPGTENLTWIVATLPEAILLDSEKTYVFKYKIFVDPSSVKAPVIGTFLIPDWTQRMWGNSNNFAKGEWIEREVEYSAASLSEPRIRLVGTDNDGIIYMDDFSLQTKEVRP